MKLRASKLAGSTLFVSLATLAALSFLAAFTLQRVTPSLRMAYQTAAWQEARVAAEAGVDSAISDLLRNSASPTPNWMGWKEKGPGGTLRPALDSTLKLVTGVVSLLGAPTRSSEPIFLDNVRVSTAGGLPTELDVQMWALQPGANARKPWYRIRSMATCALPRTAWQAPESLDAPLRRFSLRHIRPRLMDDDVGTAMTIPTPNVSRTIEVLVEPVPPFELALWTADPIALPWNGTWCIDSYDSRDTTKSAGGCYPGKGDPRTQRNGNIATNAGRPSSAPYGALIAANGARIHGAIATNGGDNPDTGEHENVSDGLDLDQEKIRDDFMREMKPFARPSGGITLPAPLFGLPFIAGTALAPTCYQVEGNLRSFTIAPPIPGMGGTIVILVNGDLDVNNGPVTIAPGVNAQIFVRGNINFHDNAINAGGAAAQLLIFGEDSSPGTRRLVAANAAVINAAFFGPTYDVSIDGSVHWHGAIVGRSFTVPSGGDGGLHYDEALAQVGAPVSFRIVRYVEDVRL